MFLQWNWMWSCLLGDPEFLYELHSPAGLVDLRCIFFFADPATQVKVFSPSRLYSEGCFCLSPIRILSALPSIKMLPSPALSCFQYVVLHACVLLALTFLHDYH